MHFQSVAQQVDKYMIYLTNILSAYFESALGSQEGQRRLKYQTSRSFDSDGKSDHLLSFC